MLPVCNWGAQEKRWDRMLSPKRRMFVHRWLAPVLQNEGRLFFQLMLELCQHSGSWLSCIFVTKTLRITITLAQARFDRHAVDWGDDCDVKPKLVTSTNKSGLITPAGGEILFWLTTSRSKTTCGTVMSCTCLTNRDHTSQWQASFIVCEIHQAAPESELR